MTRTAVGYAGGESENPTYGAVCSGHTGHAEIVEIEYDPAIVSLKELLRMFWSMHDPTMDARNYKGGQYRSAIYYTTQEQASVVELAVKEEQLSGNHRRPLRTEIRPAPMFWPAEDYHQQYYEKSKKRSALRLFL